MKFRLTLGLLAIVAGLVFGLSAMPVQAHAATAVTLSASDRSNIQAVLDLTQATLDAIQVQADHNAIQDREATLATLGNIKVYLLNMRELLGGAPANSAMLIEAPEPAAPRVVAAAPRTPAAPEAPAAPAAPVVNEPSSAPAAPAMVEETPSQDQQAATVSSSVTSKRAFWIILITAIVIAIILAIPRRKGPETVAKEDAPVAPLPPRPEEPEPVQAA